MGHVVPERKCSKLLVQMWAMLKDQVSSHTLFSCTVTHNLDIYTHNIHYTEPLYTMCIHQWYFCWCYCKQVTNSQHKFTPQFISTPWLELTPQYLLWHKIVFVKSILQMKSDTLNSWPVARSRQKWSVKLLCTADFFLRYTTHKQVMILVLTNGKFHCTRLKQILNLSQHISVKHSLRLVSFKHM